MIETPLNVLNNITTKIFHTQNPLLRKFFPYSTERLLGLITAHEIDELFFKIAKSLKIKYLIECGAHGAEASVRFIKQGGKAIAIEANPYIYKNITPKSTSRLISLNIALGENQDTLIFYIPKFEKESAQSTFLPKNDIEYKKIHVITERLATILHSNSIKNQEIAFWIDVEGMQKEVLRSSDSYLKNNCNLIKIEVETKELFIGQKWLYSDIINFLSQNDFVPIYRDFEYMNQFNVLLVKKKYRNDFNYLIEESVIRIKNKVSIFEIIVFLKNFNNLKREIKQLIINLFGEKLGNSLTKKFGSKNYIELIK